MSRDRRDFQTNILRYTKNTVNTMVYCITVIPLKPSQYSLIRLPDISMPKEGCLHRQWINWSCLFLYIAGRSDNSNM